MFERIYSLIIKEFIAVWQDKKSRALLIGPPLIQLFIFTFAATLDVKNISIGILNRDSGKHSFELIQRIKGSPFFSSVIPYANDNELKEGINSQEALIALNIDNQFSKNIDQRKQALVEVIVDGRKSNSGQIASGYVASIIENYNQDLGFLSPIKIVDRNWYNPNLIYPWFTLTGLIGTLTMLITLSVTSLSIARERELGTFDQLLVTPLSSIEILVGKSIPAILIGMSEGTLMLVAGVLIIGVPINGSIIALYLAMIVFILATVGVGMFISSISRTQQQATLGIFFAMVPSVILSGFAAPVANMPYWLQRVSDLNALKFFIFIVRGVTMRNISWSTIVQQIIPMVLIAIFTLSISAYLFKSKVGKS